MPVQPYAWPITPAFAPERRRTAHPLANRIIVSVISTLALGIATVLMPATAHAAPASVRHELTNGQHCVVAATAVRQGESAVTHFGCFRTLAAAINYATHGSIKLTPSAGLVSVDRAIRAVADQVAPASSPLLGIEYDYTSFGGSSLTLTGSGGPGCTGGYTYSFGNLSNYGWNDRIGSARTYSNCVGVHYRDRYLAGPSKSVFGSASTMGTLNNATSSIRFY